MHRCKASDIPRKAYLQVRCSDEGRGTHRRWAFSDSLLDFLQKAHQALG